MTQIHTAQLAAGISTNKLILRLLNLLLFSFLLISSATHAAVANFLYSGQELGISTFQNGKKELRLKSKVTEGIVDATNQIKTLKSELPPAKGGVVAIYSYDSKDVLSSITITAPTKTAQTLFNTIVRNIEPAKDRSNNFIKGNGEAEIAIGESLQGIKGTSLAKTSVIKLKTSEIINVQHKTTSEDLFKKLLQGTVIIWFLCFVFWKQRMKMVDGFVAAVFLTGLWTAFHLSPFSFNVSTELLYLAMLGCWNAMGWFIGAARVIRYPEEQKIWQSFVALPLFPFFVIPRIVRNTFTSGQYSGLVFFMAQLVGLIALVVPKPQAYYLMAGLFLLSGGIVRLYAFTFEYFTSSSKPWASAILTNLFWPFSILYALMKLGLLILKCIRRRFVLILFFVVAGAVLGSAWGGALLGCCIAAFSLILNIGALGVSSTGYGYASSSDDFVTNGFDFNSSAGDDFCVNPANGLPMFGGMGGFDVAGNPFGIDLNHDAFNAGGNGFGNDGF